MKRSRTIRTVALGVFLVTSAALTFATHARAEGFGFGAELGHGIKHNDDGAGLFLRGMYIGRSGAGCGVIVGTWDGDFENDVAGLTCEKRFTMSMSDRPQASIGVGVVDIEPNEVVNSDWALEVHVRWFITRHVALSATHFSNAGQEHPNKGYNFVSLEVVF